MHSAHRNTEVELSGKQLAPGDQDQFGIVSIDKTHKTHREYPFEPSPKGDAQEISHAMFQATTNRSVRVKTPMNLNFHQDAGIPVIEVERKQQVDDLISCRWMAWLAGQCPGMYKARQKVQKMEDFFAYGLLIFEMVRRILPPRPGRDLAIHFASPPRKHPLRMAAIPRGHHNPAHQPARTLWIQQSEQGSATWGSLSGKRDASAGLRVLAERMPDVGRQLPPADQVVAREPRACRQAMAVLRSVAVARVQGDMPHMLAWYRAAISAYGSAAAARLPAVPGDSGPPGGFLTPRSAASRPPTAQQVWGAFRDGVSWACTLHAVAHCRRSTAATRADGADSGSDGGGREGSKNPAAAAGVDIQRVYMDPRTDSELLSNLALALAGMAEVGVPVMWTPAEVATYPGDDDEPLLLQVLIPFGLT
jgi:hypothetical protein